MHTTMDHEATTIVVTAIEYQVEIFWKVFFSTTATINRLGSRRIAEAETDQQGDVEASRKLFRALWVVLDANIKAWVEHSPFISDKKAVLDAYSRYYKLAAQLRSDEDRSPAELELEIVRLRLAAAEDWKERAIEQIKMMSGEIQESRAVVDEMNSELIRKDDQIASHISADGSLRHQLEQITLESNSLKKCYEEESARSIMREAKKMSEEIEATPKCSNADDLQDSLPPPEEAALQQQVRELTEKLSRYEQESAERLARCQQELASEKKKSASLEALLLSRHTNQSDDGDECTMPLLKGEELITRYRRKKKLANFLQQQVEERDGVVLSLKARVAKLKSDQVDSSDSETSNDDDGCLESSVESVSTGESESTSLPDDRSELPVEVEDNNSEERDDSENDTSSDHDESSAGVANDNMYPCEMRRNINTYRTRAEAMGKKVTPWPGSILPWFVLFGILVQIIKWRYKKALPNERPKSRYKSFQSTAVAVVAFYVAFGVQHVTGNVPLKRDEQKRVEENIDIIVAKLENDCGESMMHDDADQLAAAAKKHVTSIWGKLGEVRRSADNIWSDPRERQNDRDLHYHQKRLYDAISVRFNKARKKRGK
mmetsp:Transcript_5935/g.16688  ORF Transcript_5935/g.16688 Transcript_5935/m.16688 type:complete len:603 (+) Transcript_5935:207-2015(+)